MQGTLIKCFQLVREDEERMCCCDSSKKVTSLLGSRGREQPGPTDQFITGKEEISG